MGYPLDSVDTPLTEKRGSELTYLGNFYNVQTYVFFGLT